MLNIGRGRNKGMQNQYELGLFLYFYKYWGVDYDKIIGR